MTPDAVEKSRALAAIALQLARNGDWARAARTVQRIDGLLGADGMLIAVAGWCDTLARHLGITGDRPIELRFHELESGVTETADEVTPEIAWAGQLITARM